MMPLPPRRQPVIPAARRPSRGTLKWPIGGITSTVCPGCRIRVGQVELFARHALDRDAQPAVDAQQIDAASHVLTVDIRAQREVLPWRQRILAQTRRHGEGHRSRRPGRTLSMHSRWNLLIVASLSRA